MELLSQEPKIQFSYISKMSIYFKSNKEAITNIKEIIDSEEIDCDFEYQSNYVYTKDTKDIEKLKKEINSLNYLNSLLRKRK